MRPIKLEMNAFGPFAAKQVLDFQIMKDKGLFLIMGPTGSGKTTILDAITFALYGDASGDTRECEFFKSNFVPLDEECYTEFTFQVQNKVYTIWRSPMQSRLKRDGSVKTVNSKAILTLPNKDVIEKVVTVNEKIIDILGLTKDQFKKLIVLPQGEFRKLLLAKSDEKQTIFRRIFGTGIYDQITASLYEKTKSIADTINTIQATIKAIIAGIDTNYNMELREVCQADYPDVPYILTLLKQQNKKDMEEINNLKKQMDSLNRKKDSINIEYAIEINDKFNKFKKSKDTLSHLENEKTKYQENKMLYQKLILLREILPIENSIQNDYKHIERTNQEINASTARLHTIKEQFSKVQKEYETLPLLQKKTDSYTKNIERIKQIQLDYQQIVEEKKKQEENTALLLQLQEKEKYLTAVLKRFEITEPLEKSKELLELLKQFLQSLKKWIQLNHIYNTSCTEYTKALELFFTNQAGNLAKKLQKNMPCPVCGSTMHPQPAAIPSENITQTALEMLEQKRKDAQQNVDAIKTVCAQILMKLHENALLTEVTMESIGKNLSVCKEKYQAVSQQYSAYKQSLEAYDRALKLKELHNESFLQQSADEICQQLNELQRKEIALSADQENRSENIKRCQAKIPEELLSMDRINMRIQEYRQLREKTMQMYQQITDTYQSIQSQQDKAEQQLTEAKRHVEAYKKQLEENQVIYKEKRSTAGLQSDKDYAFIKDKLPAMESILQWIDRYEKDLAITKNTIRILDKELENKQKFDIEQMKAAYTKIQEEISVCNENYIPIHTRYIKNSEAYQKLDKNWRDNEAIQKQYAHFNQLYTVTSGKNEARVSFERYILASYFDDIIYCANLRLQKMTNKRYSLSRKLEKQKGGGASGLDLEVLDIYSGCLRPITTLSGGETFMTSLALALGLADVVSQNAGGVEMNTMFIDEGFGTLDSETLNNAINCLTQLQDGGRLVGIISHVSGLEERIREKLLVTPSAGGSRAEFII